MAKSPDKVKRYGSLRHPMLEAASKGLYRFEREEQAMARLQAIAEKFILSRRYGPQFPEDGSEQATQRELALWVRGYRVLKDEEEKGYLGNFAKLFVHEMHDGRYTIKMDKLPVEKKFHPQKRRLPSKHPNWGHPVLRSVLSARPYKTVAEAAAALQALHEEYPEVSIPTGDKLYIITYSRGKETGAKPVQKVVLRIELQPDGSCLITSKENAKPFQPKEAQPKIVEGGGARSEDELAAASGKPEPKQKGYYTGMVELRRKKKRRTAPLKPKEKPADI